MLSSLKGIAGALLVLSAHAQQDSTSLDSKTHSTYRPGAYFDHKTVLIPHDDKKHRGGEDAAATSDTMIIVADGVGGWAQRGIDPGLFSKKLTTETMNKHLQDGDATPKQCMAYGLERAAEQYQGSCTVTVLKITGKDTIETTNMGDSGYSLFHIKEDGKSLDLYFRSQEMQKDFNFPYQIGSVGDDPSEGFDASHTFKHGDVVIAYSDGVSDNLYTSHFNACIEAQLVDGLLQSPSEAADCLARKAYFLGKNMHYNAPFSKNAQIFAKENPQHPRSQMWANSTGGKHDDIVVTVGQIWTLPEGEDRPRPSNGEKDTFFPENIHVYTGDVPRNYPKRPPPPSKSEL